MKCKLTEKKNMMILLIVGLGLILAGILANSRLSDEQHLLVRCAGFVTGAGMALTLIGAGVLIWRRMVGEARARDSELSMQDERGQMIAYRAQSVTAVAAVGALIVVLLVALVRGDELYMFLCAALCLAVTGVKFAALHLYGERM